MTPQPRTLILAFTLLASLGWTMPQSIAQDKDESLDWLLPSTKAKLPFAKETPIYFVGPQNVVEYKKLTAFWNPGTEEAVDPDTGAKVTRPVVRIKLPLGLTQAPKVPAENPMTVQRWHLGRRLYFDPALSADGTVSCSSCHQPAKGFTDQEPNSQGIFNLRGGMSAPTVMNSAFNTRQFWDGRAASLEEQAHGPVQNPIEMFDGKGTAWHHCINRIRKKEDYRQRFLEAFGHEPTKDAVTMAIAAYERTVLNGNSVHDRAELAMKQRVAEEESVDFTIKPKDYEKVLKAAFAAKDVTALAALKLDLAQDQVKVKAVAEQISKGRDLFFNKARCALCHVGENFMDGDFHNLGVGVKDGKLPPGALGRYAALPTGHKNPAFAGAFKTPPLRGLVSTAPYMHDGSEKALEEVVDFYDRGGNANEHLSPKMRNLEAERAYVLSKKNGTPYTGPKVYLLGADQKPIVPFQLGLTKEDKASLVLFLRSLEGEVDPLVTAPDKRLPSVSAK